MNTEGYITSWNAEAQRRYWPRISIRLYAAASPHLRNVHPSRRFEAPFGEARFSDLPPDRKWRNVSQLSPGVDIAKLCISILAAAAKSHFRGAE
jgi:hypothetical protein